MNALATVLSAPIDPEYQAEGVAFAVVTVLGLIFFALSVGGFIWWFYRSVLPRLSGFPHIVGQLFVIVIVGVVLLSILYPVFLIAFSLVGLA